MTAVAQVEDVASSVDKYYGGITYAETASEPNPWIRTKYRPVGGSTAFGPAQITGTTLKSYIKQGLLSKESSAFAKNIMVPMYDNFKKYGAEPKRTGYRKEYDYGGSGLFNPEVHGASYEKMAKEMMAVELAKAKGDVNKFVTVWRGKSQKDDPRYFEAFARAILSNSGIGSLKK